MAKPQSEIYCTRDDQQVTDCPAQVEYWKSKKPKQEVRHNEFEPDTVGSVIMPRRLLEALEHYEELLDPAIKYDLRCRSCILGPDEHGKPRYVIGNGRSDKLVLEYIKYDEEKIIL